MEQIAGWWDGFELWVAGLPFIPQFLVVLLGMVPISVAIAMGLDRTLRAVLHLLGRDRTPEGPAAGLGPAGVADPASPSADPAAGVADPAAPAAGRAGSPPLPPDRDGAAPISTAGDFVGPLAAAGPAGVR